LTVKQRTQANLIEIAVGAGNVNRDFTGAQIAVTVDHTGATVTPALPAPLSLHLSAGGTGLLPGDYPITFDPDDRAAFDILYNDSLLGPVSVRDNYRVTANPGTLTISSNIAPLTAISTPTGALGTYANESAGAIISIASMYIGFNAETGMSAMSE